MTRPENVSEATGTTWDTTMSSSWGTCNGRARRWQDVVSMAEALNVGGAQRWQDILSVAEALNIRGVRGSESW